MGAHGLQAGRVWLQVRCERLRSAGVTHVPPLQVRCERLKMELAGEQASLKLQLGKQLWAVPRSWREALPKA